MRAQVTAIKGITMVDCPNGEWYVVNNLGISTEKLRDFPNHSRIFYEDFDKNALVVLGVDNDGNMVISRLTRTLNKMQEALATFKYPSSSIQIEHHISIANIIGENIDLFFNANIFKATNVFSRTYNIPGNDECLKFLLLRLINGDIHPIVGTVNIKECQTWPVAFDIATDSFIDLPISDGLIITDYLDKQLADSKVVRKVTDENVKRALTREEFINAAATIAGESTELIKSRIVNLSKLNRERMPQRELHFWQEGE